MRYLIYVLLAILPLFGYAAELKTKEALFKELSHYYGKPVIVAYMATWCTYCVKEIPLLNRLHDSRDFIIIGVNTETTGITQNDLDTYKDKNKVGYPLFLGGADVSFTNGAVPSQLFICPNGKIGHINKGVLTVEDLAEITQLLFTTRCVTLTS